MILFHQLCLYFHIADRESIHYLIDYFHQLSIDYQNRNDILQCISGLYLFLKKFLNFIIIEFNKGKILVTFFEDIVNLNIFINYHSQNINENINEKIIEELLFEGNILISFDCDDVDFFTLQQNLFEEKKKYLKNQIEKILTFRDHKISWLLGQLLIDLPYNRDKFRKIIYLHENNMDTKDHIVNLKRQLTYEIIRGFDKNKEKLNCKVKF